MSRGGRPRVGVTLRTCVGCKAVRPRAELQRFVRGADGRLCCERRTALPGRGGYVCPSRECTVLAVRQLDRAFRGAGPRVSPEALWGAVQNARNRALDGASCVDPPGAKV